MKKKQSLIGLIIIILLLTAVIVLLVRHFHIKNFNIVKPMVLYTSGQPKGMDYTRLFYKYHIATIVNIRSPYEHREQNWYSEEISWAKENGVKYIELPINKGHGKTDYFPSPEVQKEFLQIMADKDNLPVLLHGSTGKKRVPLLTAVWLIKSQGYPPQQTLEVVDKINGERNLTEEEKNFISSLVEQKQ